MPFSVWGLSVVLVSLGGRLIIAGKRSPHGTKRGKEGNERKERQGPQRKSRENKKLRIRKRIEIKRKEENMGVGWEKEMR